MRRLKSVLLVFVDIFIVAMVPFLALILRFEGMIHRGYIDLLMQYIPIIVIGRIGVFYLFGLYRRLWRYASINELLCIISAVSISSIVLTIYLIGINSGLPRSVHVVSWFLDILLIGGSRLALRVYYHLRTKGTRSAHLKTNTLIIGAGDAGAMIAREIMQRYSDSKNMVGFIDDDPYKKDKMMLGARILGTRENIKQVAETYCVDEIIIAMPSISGANIREMITICKNTKCDLKILPDIYELIDGRVTVQQLRSVDVEDLLRRDPVSLDLAEIAAYLKDKRVLITGAGGSIGSELCRQVAQISPKNLIILGKGENSIYEINHELRERFPTIDIFPVIADVRDKDRITRVFSDYRPQVVFHAAAHKHVPLMEVQPREAICNNIFGTQTVAEAADRFNAETFIMISTDKAVNPTSVMGATKRAAEMIIQYMNSVSQTRYAAVRFGNVLGSRGSVIPLFKKQIARGGPVTVTHPEMNRYFMTIPEATQLVLQAGSMASGGEVFVLDMGQPVKIVDLAKDLITLSGLEPGKDIEVKFTGLRPGEKLFEELLTAEEGTSSTKHEKIFVANLNSVDKTILINVLHQLKNVGESISIKELLQELIHEYKPYKLMEKESIIEAAKIQPDIEFHSKTDLVGF